MFETCNNLEELNKLRLAEIRNGHPAVIVNKEYAKRKAVLLSSQHMGYKKLTFVEKEVVPKTETVMGIDNVWWNEDEPYTIHVEV